MFPYIGIMADQEPRRAFTPSGLHPMGSFDSGDSVDVTADITGTSNFTFMIWAYPTTANQYIFKTSDDTAFLQIKSDGKLRFQILNTNLTNSVVESASAISLNTLQMITVTGSTTNGLNLYINDVLNNSSLMPANNNVAGKTWQIGTNYDGSLALFRSWSKELALADVEAHYAYDEGLSLQGGVAVSAMTTDQKTDLEFAVEMIQDVPYDGYEFDDRSTNKYTVTNNGATLIGVSLQVYTDANDLPNGGSQIYDVNSSTYNGVSSYAEKADGIATDFILQTNEDLTLMGWFKSTSANLMAIFNCDRSELGDFVDVHLSSGKVHFRVNGSQGIRGRITDSTYNDDQWHFFACRMKRSPMEVDITIDGVPVSTSLTHSNNVTNQLDLSVNDLSIGRRHYTNSLYFLGNISFISFHKTYISDANILAEYNAGMPFCFANSVNESTITEGWKLSNYNGNTGDEYTGYKGVQDLTTVTGVTLTDTGLDVECGGGGGGGGGGSNSPFIFTVKTDNQGDSNDDQFQMGTRDQGVYNCTVDWGDGNSDTITTWNDPRWLHTYSVAGTYTITISGTRFTYPYFSDIFFNDSKKILDVSQWGLTDYGTTASHSFNSCSNLTISASDVPDTSSVLNFNSVWRDCSSLTSFPLIDTSSVVIMVASWRGCFSLTSFPLIDTSSATTMAGVWSECSSLTSFPLINTSLVTNIGTAWKGCSSLISFPLIDTSSATLMAGTWNGCSSLTSFPLINTSSVTSMLETWLDCYSLADFPLIDVSACTNFTDTWKGCALNSASIDNIMQALVNGNQNNLTTDISGGTNLGFASWSAGAVANYNTLISRGWTITTNP